MNKILDKVTSKNIYIVMQVVFYLSVLPIIALAFSGDSLDKSNTVTIYDNNGKSTFMRNIDGKIIDIAINEDYMYVLLDREILRIDIRSGIISRTNSFEGASKILISANDVVVCTEAAAYYLTFE